jgi:hypothetical protein
MEGNTTTGMTTDPAVDTTSAPSPSAEAATQSESTTAGTEKTKETPQQPAEESTGAATPVAADDPNEMTVRRGDYEAIKRKADEFDRSQNTEAKLKAKYAKLTFISQLPNRNPHVDAAVNHIPNSVLMEYLPETENAEELTAALTKLCTHFVAWLKVEEKRGAIHFRTVGGSPGGNPPQAALNTNLSASQLLAMRRG